MKRLTKIHLNLPKAAPTFYGEASPITVFHLRVKLGKRIQFRDSAISLLHPELYS